MSDSTITLHATAVAIDGRGLMLRGASGRGKSGLALELMTRGASLVADDRVILSRDTGGIIMRAPETLRGLIEARGLGILTADHVPQARLIAVLDLDMVETDRLPPYRETDVLGQKIPLLHFFESPYFPAALVQYLKGNRRDPKCPTRN